MKYLISCITISMLFTLSVCCVSAAEVDVSWTCLDSGFWTNINCWDPGTHIPDNDNGSGDTYHVHFNSGGDVVCSIDSGNSIQVDSLDVNQLAMVRLGPNGPGYLTIEGGQVVNDGFIDLASNHWDTAFVITGDTTFSSPAGTGSLVIGPDVHNKVRATTPGDRIINEVGHSFQGAYYLGYDQVLFTNHGTIKSDIIDTYLYLNPYDTGTNYNDGIIDSTIQSICRMESSTWDNSNGLIHASDGCRTEISGCTIFGGEIASDGTGVVQIQDNTSISNLTIAGGTIEVPNVNGATGYIAGSIINNGIFQVNSDHFGTHLKLAAQTHFTGTGTLFLGNHGRNYIDSDGDSYVLINGPLHTIHGADFLGNDLLVINNQGTINADTPSGVLDVNPANTSGNINEGLLAASNQGILQLSDGQWDNDQGIIEAQDDSIVRLYGAVVIDGVIRSQGTGVIELMENAHISESTLETGIFRLPNSGGANAYLSGTITNNANLELANDHWGTHLKLADDTTLSGDGFLYIGNYGRNYLDSDGDIHTLTNSSNHTIHGGDYLGNDLVLFDNKGTIAADVAGWTLYLDSTDTGISTSTGTIKAENQGILTIEPGDWDSTDGQILADDGSKIVLNSGAGIMNGALESRGTGVFELQNSSNLRDFAVQDSVTLQITDWHSANIDGDITNNGSVTIESLNNNVSWNCLGATTFSGSGMLTINNTVEILGNSITFTNDSGHTFQTNTSRNIGIDFVNNGTLDVPDGAAPLFTGTFASTAGSTIEVAGTLKADQIISMEGILAGIGTINASVAMADGSVLSPGNLVPGANPGTLTITDLEMKNGATINYELDSNGDDLIVINNDLVFGDTATINVTAPENYLATGEDHIVFQVAGTISDLPQWTIKLPDGWTSDGIVIEGGNVVLKNVLLPYGVRLDMPVMARIGQEFHVTGLLDNPGAMATDVAVFFILQVYNDFWFYDSWAHYSPPEALGIDWVVMDIPPGTTEVIILPSFTWPDTGPTAVDGLLFWGAALTGDMTAIDGRYTMQEWGYGP